MKATKEDAQVVVKEFQIAMTTIQKGMETRLHSLLVVLKEFDISCETDEQFYRSLAQKSIAMELSEQGEIFQFESTEMDLIKSMLSGRYKK